MASNPIDTRVDALNQQIADAEQQIAEAQGQIAQSEASIVLWYGTPSGGQSPSAQNAIIAHQSNITTWQGRIAALRTELDSLRAQLATALEDQRQFNENLGRAAENGLTGEAAIEHAKALTEESKGRKALTYAGAAAIVILLIAGLIWFRQKRKKK